MLAYFDTRPFILLAGIAIFCVCIALIAVLRGILPRPVTICAAIAAYIFILLFLLYGSFVGYGRLEKHHMLWHIERVDRSSKSTHVVLAFRDYPGNEIVIYSDQLAEYLNTLPSPDVVVAFKVTCDYGRVRGFHETQIGDLKSWSSEGGYYRRSGESTTPF